MSKASTNTNTSAQHARDLVAADVHTAHDLLSSAITRASRKGDCTLTPADLVRLRRLRALVGLVAGNIADGRDTIDVPPGVPAHELVVRL